MYCQAPNTPSATTQAAARPPYIILRPRQEMSKYENDTCKKSHQFNFSSHLIRSIHQSIKAYIQMNTTENIKREIIRQKILAVHIAAWFINVPFQVPQKIRSWLPF